MFDAFAGQFQQAIISMLKQPEYAEVFRLFFTAFQYRSQFPWLEEHQPHRPDQNGLAVALQAALATYLLPETAVLEAPLISLSPPQKNYQAQSSILSEALIEEFIQAITMTMNEQFSLERFASRLARSSPPLDASAPDMLQKHIAGALYDYARQREMGLSPDAF